MAKAEKSTLQTLLISDLKRSRVKKLSSVPTLLVNYES